MFESKKCKNCGKSLKKDWVACPYCGEGARERIRARGYVDDIEKEFERIDKMMGPRFIRFPRINLESPFRGGINIVIRGETERKPRIDVKTSGEYKKLEPQIKKKLGIRERVEDKVKRKHKIPKITEEPETKIKRIGNKQTISIKLPDVKNVKDIEIRKLQQSLEVKAFARDKAYFKLIPTRPNAQISDRSFKNGILKIEII